MKLAEALSIRKDLQKRIQQLEQRIKNIYCATFTARPPTSLTATPLRRYDRSVSLMLSSLASRLTSTLVVCASSTWRFKD